MLWAQWPRWPGGVFGGKRWRCLYFFSIFYAPYGSLVTLATFNSWPLPHEFSPVLSNGPIPLHMQISLIQQPSAASCRFLLPSQMTWWAIDFIWELSVLLHRIGLPFHLWTGVELVWVKEWPPVTLPSILCGLISAWAWKFKWPMDTNKAHLWAPTTIL